MPSSEKCIRKDHVLQEKIVIMKRSHLFYQKIKIPFDNGETQPYNGTRVNEKFIQNNSVKHFWEECKK